MSKLKKIERDTEIYYNQSNDPMQIRIHDPKLIRKLTTLAADFPELCRLTEVNEYYGTCCEAEENIALSPDCKAA